MTSPENSFILQGRVADLRKGRRPEIPIFRGFRKGEGDWGCFFTLSENEINSQRPYLANFHITVVSANMT